MQFQSVDIVGQIHVQRVDTKPVWEPSDMGRIIYVKDEKILYYGTNEGWSRTTGNGMRPVLVIEDYAAEDQDLCLVDTRSGPITITLPPNPKVGSQIGFVDVSGTFETNYCTLIANGRKIQRTDKNFILDINDFSGTLIYDPLTTSWKVNIDGVVQLLGNATLWVHKALLVAEDIIGPDQGQQQFNLEWEYNPYHDNIAVFVDGACQFEFEKTNSQSITLAEPVPAGTKVLVLSIPLEGAFNIEDFATISYLDDLYTKTEDLFQFICDNAGHGSGLDADTVDTYHASDFILKAELLTEIKKIDGDGSGLDADMTDGYHASKVPAPNVLIATDEYGKIDSAFLPWARGGLEIVSSYPIIGGASAIEINNLDNEAGYLLKIYNMTPEINDVSLFMRAYNKTQDKWTGFESWTCQYSDHLSPGLREFNTDSDMLMARHVGSTYHGINFNVWIDGFTSTNSYSPVSAQSTATFLSTEGNYAAMYQSVGTFRKSDDVYSALRIYFNNGLIGVTGRVVLYKFIKELI